jgi:hypothetical protein
MAQALALAMLAAYPVAIAGICQSFGMQGFAAVLVVTLVLGRAENKRKLAKERFSEFSQMFKSFTGDLQELCWLLQVHSEEEVEERLGNVSFSDLKMQCERLGVGVKDACHKGELVQGLADEINKARNLDLDQIRF